jgi:hypothetical protein
MGSIPLRSREAIFRESLPGVSFVGFHLWAVYRLHVQRAAQDELDADAAAQVRRPVPGKDALHCQDQVLPVGLERIGEGLCRSRQVPVYESRSFVVHDADVHCPCVQIDTAVKSALFGVESHKASSSGYGFMAESIIPCLQEGAFMSVKANAADAK